MISGTNATGRRCLQYSHTTQHHGWPRRSCSSVGAGGVCFMRHQRQDRARRRDAWLDEPKLDGYRLQVIKE